VARALLERYVERYPGSPWTWVARIRIAQSLESEDRMDEAAAAYLEAADGHEMPMARVLGAAYAARVYEAAGQFTRALALHRRALAGWDNAFGLTYRSDLRRAPPGDPMVLRQDASEVRSDVLAARVEELTRSLSSTGGWALERARALFARERYEDAARELDRMLATFPASMLRAEARELANRARVEAALVLARAERSDRGERPALEMLQRVRAEPLDAAVTAAHIMRSAILLLDGSGAEAETLLGEALDAWHARQPVKRPASALEEDVAQIRRVVFLPRGGDIYSDGRWNAFRWPDPGPPYMLVNSDVQVTLHGGEALTVSLSEPLSDSGRLVFFDTETIALLSKMLSGLGGTERREPRQIMETPNQPVGDSVRILGLWQRFFPARPGHWGGWELETYPVITRIRFADEARTKAAARVTIGYSGATVELEKQDGRWIARRLTNWWIT
jgi:tetratricopeptide (TPR) repeat protein